MHGDFDFPCPTDHLLAPRIGRRLAQMNAVMLGNQSFAVGLARTLFQFRIGIQR
ncbi:Uncharacterised protein [Vibrio cholerae]|nr:Uncharacterised protein [Vibrio cholerae]CSD02104.1 Uncharacterised protein [Vibrio cholerae]